jgi:hypothetical protein
MQRTEGEVISPSSRILDTPTLLFLLAGLIFLYYLLFVPPLIPFRNYEDGIHFLNSGKRMYEGELIYRDFFEMVTPGLALVNFFLFELFGPRLWIPNLTLLFLGLGLAWLGVVIAKKLMRPSLALLPSAIFLSGVYGRQLDATHHWYSLLTATVAIAVLMERRTPARIATAGFFCGLTACFTQTRGLAVVVGFGAYLWWESRRRHEDRRGLLKKEAWLIAGFLAALLAVNGYFIWKAGLSRFLWCTVIFVIKYGPKYAGSNAFFPAIVCNLPEFVSLHNFILLYTELLFLYAVIPGIYILFFARYWRESEKRPMEFWERPMLLAMVGSSLLLGIAPAPTPFRLAASALPGIILLVWFIDSPRKLARVIAGLFAVGAVLVALNAVARERPVPDPKWILTTPQGKLAVGDQVSYEEYTWIQEHTRPLEYFFEAADTAGDMYFYLNLRNPIPLPFVTNYGFTTREQVTEAIRGLEQHQVRYIVWRAPERDTIPARGNPSDGTLGPLWDYVHNNYRRVRIFGKVDAVWERVGK